METLPEGTRLLKEGELIEKGDWFYYNCRKGSSHWYKKPDFIMKIYTNLGIPYNIIRHQSEYVARLLPNSIDFINNN